MRKISLTPDRYSIYYGAITGSPEGFKGLTAVKNALGVLVKLEELGVKKLTKPVDPKTGKEVEVWSWNLKEEQPTAIVADPEDDEAAGMIVPSAYFLELVEEEYSALRSAMDVSVWTGHGLRLVSDAYQGLDEAK